MILRGKCVRNMTVEEKVAKIAPQGCLNLVEKLRKSKAITFFVNTLHHIGALLFQAQPWVLVQYYQVTVNDYQFILC